MKLNKIDHLVLTVRDIKVSCDFYVKVLGMDEVSFGQGRKAVVFGNQKINFHPPANKIEPRAARATPGSADLCFLTGQPLPEVMAHLQNCGIEIIEGPIERTGATGPIRSVYIRDPDHNLIEIATYQLDI